MELEKTMKYNIYRNPRPKATSKKNVRNRSSESQLNSMKTADRIISVEDEETRLNKRRNQMMSVGDIVTLEDEGYYDDIKKIIEEDRKNNSTNINDEINSKKILKIEEASFEEVMRVANIRLEAEKKAELAKIEAEKKAELARLSEEKALKAKLEAEKKAEVLRLEAEKLEEAKKIAEQDNQKNEDENIKKKSSKFKVWGKSSEMKDNSKNVEVKKSGKSTPTSDLSEEIEMVEDEVKDAENAVTIDDKKNIDDSTPDIDNKEEKEEVDTVEKSDEDPAVENGQIDPKDTEEKDDDDYTIAVIDDGSGSGGGFGSSVKRFFKRLAMVVLVLVVLLYIAGCAYFKGRFYPNTIVNGINVSYKTPKELDKLAADKLDGYELKLAGREGVRDVVEGDDVDLEYVADGSSEKVKEEQGFLAWPISYLTEDKIDGKLNLKLDDAKLKNVVLALNIFDKKNIKDPVPQHQAFSKKEDKFVLDPGTLGSIPVEKNVISFVKGELLKESTQSTYSPQSYTKQEYDPVDNHMKAAIENINKHLSQKITYDFEYEKYNVTKEDLGNMYIIDKNNKYEVSLNKDKVRDFVRSLSRKYSTYGDTREFYSVSKGGMLKVSGGIYGWLIDREKETDALYNIVKEGKDVSNRKPIYYQTAVSRQKNDLGTEYIEIDLSKQYMWYVKDKEVLVSTPIVSGMPGNGDATPTGIYPINYKTRHATLRGPGYASPVSYWIPFNGNIGIHDASWQPVFGGSRYLYAGSHGCINTPYSKVAQIYNLAREGLPVIVHN